MRTHTAWIQEVRMYMNSTFPSRIIYITTKGEMGHTLPDKSGGALSFNTFFLHSASKSAALHIP